jgi:uncharacterized protein YjdB
MALLLPACGEKEPPVIAVDSVTVSPSTLNMTEGDTQKLQASVSPSDATDKTVTWSSSNDQVASVSGGTVTALKAGTATITATAGGKKGTCSVTVAAKVYSVTGVKLDITSKELTEGESFTLKATVEPDNATDKSVTWSSSANDVASVDQNGKVTALKAGTATITVTTKDGSKKATCAITVKAKVIPVTGVTLDASAMEVDEGFSFMLTATVNPDNATDKSVTWSSSDATVATVSQTGEVTGVKKGTATITVTTNNGGKTATCTVTVIARVASVSLDKNTLELAEGEFATLVATVLPENANEKSVTWSSSDEAVAKVDQTGKVTAVKKGTATITVTTTDGGKTASCTVTVIAKVASVSLDKNEMELTEGESATLTATVFPETANDKSVTWSSSDEAVATVDQTGKVTAVKKGTATITVTTNDGGKTATCAVTVKRPTTEGGNEGYGNGGEYGEGNF